MRTRSRPIDQRYKQYDIPRIYAKTYKYTNHYIYTLQLLYFRQKTHLTTQTPIMCTYSYIYTHTHFFVINHFMFGGFCKTTLYTTINAKTNNLEY